MSYPILARYYSKEGLCYIAQQLSPELVDLFVKNPDGSAYQIHEFGGDLLVVIKKGDNPETKIAQNLNCQNGAMHVAPMRELVSRTVFPFRV